MFSATLAAYEINSIDERLLRRLLCTARRPVELVLWIYCPLPLFFL